MKVVKIDKGSVPVTIHVSITGLVAWRYYYAADEKEFSGNSKNNQEHVHYLGRPDELDFDYNEWEIQLASLGEDSVECILSIVWKQDAKILHEWNNKADLTNDEPAVKINGEIMLAVVE